MSRLDPLTDRWNHGCGHSTEDGWRTHLLRDIRRTVETQLASIGVTKDIRAQLLSHGLSGVQAAHYDRYEYMNEKHAALVTWENVVIDTQKVAAS